jgi:uncharacterized protein YabE (DUF348 family)
MFSKLKRFLWLLIPVVGLVVGYLLLARPVTMTIDGRETTVTTRAFTVRGALRDAGIRVSANDEITPSAGTWIGKSTVIEFNHAGLIRVWVAPNSEMLPVNTSARTPEEIVRAAGIEPKPGDAYKINGLPVKPNEVINSMGGLVLQYTPSYILNVIVDGGERQVTSTAPTIGQALWKAGIVLYNGDVSEPSTDAQPADGMEVTITRGQPLEIHVDGQVVRVNSTASSVGDALQLAGVALQDMDYSKPAESEPLPADGKIEVIRVTEEILVEQSSIPYTVEYVADDTLELDQTKVKVEGSYGLQAKRVRVRYENGVEVARTDEGTVILKEPITRQEAYGTQIVYKTIDTPDGPITYYRAITVTATSYSPCNSGVDECLYGTAYGLPVQKGVIAVRLAWYQFLKGTKMYVPGYGIGTVADTGYYPYNPNWIDLGYTDAEFKLYGKFYPSITVYLLAPAPSYVPGIMP